MDCSSVLHSPQAASPVVICIVPSASIWPAVAILVSLVAAGVAVWNIRSARELARKKATLDLIEKFESSDHYRSLTDAFSTARDGGRFRHLVKPLDPASKVLRGRVIDYLNHYELVAIGVQQAILDAGIYRAWMQNSYVRDWDAAAGWIRALRQRQPNPLPEAYVNFEWAAHAWSLGDWWLRDRLPVDPRTPIARRIADVPVLQHVDAPPADPYEALPLDL